MSTKKHEDKYIVEKVLNHNTIICVSESSNESFIFFGKGIGFNIKSGNEFVVDQNVESNMMVLDANQSKQYRNLVANLTNDKLADIVQTIVLEAKRYFEGDINPQLHISLLDHLNFTLDRQRVGIEIAYPFLNEIYHVYPKEYKFAQEMLKFINDNMNNEFPESELGFLVLHFHAAITDKKVSSILLQQQIFHELLKIIETELDKTIDPKSIYYTRLLVHIDYAIKRSKNNIKIENILLDSIKNNAPDDYSLSLKLNKHLMDKYHICLSEDEIGYLSLHINNLRNKQNIKIGE